ncbi:MAG: glycosyltransferase family 9 protein [Candidatus Omnitrophica bacterium]|nr:glycosyltransferase family 9 protein [Candidatus Omnitrophota bacterium]
MPPQLKNQRFLIFELNWLGDIIFSLPLIEALKKGCVGARVTCIVVPRYKKILEKCVLVDGIIELSDRRGMGSLWEKLLTVLKISGKFDVCFLLKPSKSKSLMALAAGIPRRVGFTGKKYSLTDTVEMDLTAIHRVDSLVSLAFVMGIGPGDNRYSLKISNADLCLALDLLETISPGLQSYVAIHPGGNWGAKRWDKENFVFLIKRILEKYSDIKVFITGAPDDSPLAELIRGGVNDPRCYNIAGKTGLDTLVSLFKLSKAVISADSGPLHLASAAGADTVSLFGPTSPLVTGPRGKGRNIVISHDVDCEIPCYETICPKNFGCMRAIQVEEVFGAVVEIIGERS